VRTAGSVRDVSRDPRYDILFEPVHRPSGGENLHQVPAMAWGAMRDTPRARRQAEGSWAVVSTER
jgi:hypothetical protein